VYHYQGPLEPERNPSYCQLFFLDPTEATRIRSERNSEAGLDITILRALDEFVRAENHYSELYYRAHDILNRNPDLSSLRLTPQLRLIPNYNNADPRRYNLPTITSELAALIPDIPGEYGSPSFRDILLYPRTRPGSSSDFEHSLTRIYPNHPLYLPLHYVLFFPRGGQGYHRGLRLIQTNSLSETERQNPKLSARMYYRFHLHTRARPFQSLHRGATLFQQFVVDAWASTEGMDLDYVRYNQPKLRADRYATTHSAIQRNETPQNIGQRVILPSTFTGGDRFMQQLYQDSMAIVRYFGRPSLFITFTTNPEWEEITRELLNDENGRPMQTWRNRPDLVSRVFNLKLKEMLRELRHGNIFGQHVASVYTIEFQKRGLPHAHILLFLNKDSQFDTPEKIDEIISAEIPDPTEDPDLYDIVTKFMIHQPCQANVKSPCMKDYGPGLRCSKKFPRAFTDDTILDDNSYPSYRRRPDRFSATIKNPVNKRETLTVGNDWIVPYNPYLCKKYRAHINVEVCGTIRAIRYIHKYIYKGSDRATVELDTSMDEIKQYVNCRYIGSSAAVWKLFEFPIHGQNPPVMGLGFHLPGLHFVSFDCAAPTDEVMETIGNKKTPLMAFFEYNSEHPHSEKYLYHDFPLHFTWHSKDQLWKPRQRGYQIGRMYQANPFQGELYYLRCLLTVVRGATSFESLRLLDGILHPSFEAACRARGLISSDSNWHLCFQEGKDLRTGWYLRRLLISAMLYGGLSDASNIWNCFGDHLCDDLLREIGRRGLRYDPNVIARPDLDYGLFLILQELILDNHSLLDFNLPDFINDWDRDRGNPLIRYELDYDCAALATSAAARELVLNVDQLYAYNAILSKLETDPSNALFFLNGPGGTGKTFLYRCLCDRLRSRQKIILCVASTGIAALLLPGGRTAHKRFRIPIDITEDSSCFIQRCTQLADLLRATDLILWDEAPMTNKLIFNAVDRTLQDIRHDLPGEDNPFGGIPTIFGGDFQQILPVIPHGNRADTVQSCLQYSDIWPHLTQLRLQENMRLSGTDISNTTFATWLQDLSFRADLNGYIEIPDMIYRTSCRSDFINRIYPPEELINSPTNPSFFIGRAILCTRNITADNFNNILIEDIPGELYTFESFNHADINDNALGREELTAEYLRSLTIPSLPPGILHVRIGAPLLLMRNLDPQHGLCNGTRLTLLRAARNCLEVRINGGDFDGECRLLYRCALSTSTDISFTLTRTQFPIKLAFAMTINKSQGQSLHHVGIDLQHEVFTHGQLYVALSRTTDVHNISILLSENNVDGKIKNIVYPEVLSFLSQSAFVY
jgi:hypothetical protein